MTSSVGLVGNLQVVRVGHSELPSEVPYGMKVGLHSQGDAPSPTT